MSRIKRDCLHTMYLIGGVIIFVLSVVALVSFWKAVSYVEPKPIQPRGFADSIQLENLKKDLSVLKVKVDSLDDALQQKPKVIYRHIKSKKDSSVIELHVHNEME